MIEIVVLAVVALCLVALCWILVRDQRRNRPAPEPTVLLGGIEVSGAIGDIDQSAVAEHLASVNGALLTKYRALTGETFPAKWRVRLIGLDDTLDSVMRGKNGAVALRDGVYICTIRKLDPLPQRWALRHEVFEHILPHAAGLGWNRDHKRG